jgi:hypothetical protein
MPKKPEARDPNDKAIVFAEFGEQSVYPVTASESNTKVKLKTRVKRISSISIAKDDLAKSLKKFINNASTNRPEEELLNRIIDEAIAECCTKYKIDQNTNKPNTDIVILDQSHVRKINNYIKSHADLQLDVTELNITLENIYGKVEKKKSFAELPSPTTKLEGTVEKIGDVDTNPNITEKEIVASTRETIKVLTSALLRQMTGPTHKKLEPMDLKIVERSITSYLGEKKILLKDFVIKEGELATIKDKLSGPFHRRYKETLSKITIESTAAAINKIMKEKAKERCTIS